MLFVQKVHVQNLFVSQTLRKEKRLLRKSSVLWQLRNVPLNVPLDAFVNYI